MNDFERLKQLLTDFGLSFRVQYDGPLSFITMEGFITFNFNSESKFIDYENAGEC